MRRALKNLALIHVLTTGTSGLAQELVEASEPVISRQSATSNADEPSKARPLSNHEYQQMERLRVASASTVRRFHEVLDELLAEFGHDVKMGQINGLKNLAIRNVEVSNAIPRTYEQYLELLVAERIRENSRIRLVSCLPCKMRTSRLVEGKLLISSPRSNIETLTKAADQLGIDFFMDVVMVYHSTHMVLAFQVFSADTKEMVWARTYNSETIRSRYQKLAIDYSQVERGRIGDDYAPEYRFLVGIGGASIPNVGGDANDSSMVSFHLRGTEKFNNRRSEFGLLMSIYLSTNNFVADYPAEGREAIGRESAEELNDDLVDPESRQVVARPFRQGLGLYGIYAFNFLNGLESYNRIRYGISAAAGIFAATGYLTPSLRIGGDVYMGRRFATSLGVVALAPSKVLIDGEFIRTAGGTGFELAFVFNY